MELTFFHYVGIAAALFTAVWISVRAGKNIKNNEDYSVGGRSAGTTTITGGMLGVLIGGASTAGTAQMAFSAGMVALTFSFGLALGMLLLGCGYAQKIRMNSFTTVPEIMTVYYGIGGRVICGLASMVGLFLAVCASMLTAIHILMLIFSAQALTAILLIVMMIGLLLYVGGLNGSGLAGVFKTVLVAIVLLTGGYLSFSGLGGWTGLQNSFAPAMLDIFGGNFNNTVANSLALIIGIFVAQSYTQVIVSAVSTEVAVKSVRLAALIVLPLGLPTVLIGMFMRLHHPDITPIMALPLYLLNYLPDWLGGIGLAAVLLSCFGSIGGIVLGMSTIMVKDVCAPFMRERTDTFFLILNRSFVLGLLSLVALFCYLNMDGMVLTWNYLSMSFRSSGLFFPYFLALFVKRRVRVSYALAAMVLGTAASLALGVVYTDMMHTLIPAMLLSLVICLVGMRTV